MPIQNLKVVAVQDLNIKLKKDYKAAIILVKADFPKVKLKM